MRPQSCRVNQIEWFFFFNLPLVDRAAIERVMGQLQCGLRESGGAWLLAEKEVGGWVGWRVGVARAARRALVVADSRWPWLNLFDYFGLKLGLTLRAPDRSTEINSKPQSRWSLGLRPHELGRAQLAVSRLLSDLGERAMWCRGWGKAGPGGGRGSGRGRGGLTRPHGEKAAHSIKSETISRGLSRKPVEFGQPLEIRLD